MLKNLSLIFKFLLLFLLTFIIFTSCSLKIKEKTPQTEAQNLPQVIDEQVIDKIVSDEQTYNFSLYILSGRIYQWFGKYASALRYFEKALTVAEESGNGELISTANNILSGYYSRIGESETALEYAQQALANYLSTQPQQDTPTHFFFLNTIAQTYLDLGNERKALDSYQQALAIAKKMQDPKLQTIVLNNLASFYSFTGKYDLASSTLAETEELINTFDLDPRSLNRYQLLENKANNYYRQRQYDNALKYYQQALTITRQLNNPPLEAIILQQIGLVYTDTNQSQEALKFLQEAMTIYESFRLGLDDENKISLLDKQQNIYISLQQVLIQENQIETALEISERGRARALLDLLEQKNANLPEVEKNVSLPDINSALMFMSMIEQKQVYEPVSSIDINDIKRIARQQQATLVEYSIVNNHLYIWVISPQGKINFRTISLDSFLSAQYSFAEFVDINRLFRGIGQESIISMASLQVGMKIRLITDEPDWETWKIISVNPDKETVTVRLGSWNDTIEPNEYPISQISEIVDPNQDNLVSANQYLQELYQLLIEPIALLLPKSPLEKVIFIPQGFLFNVPFPALQDQQGRYLIEKHTILTAPSIEILDVTQKINQTSSSSEILVVGNPTMPYNPLPPIKGNALEKLNQLPHAETEAKYIAELFKVSPLIGNQATKTSVVEKISSARIIHLATHGIFNDLRGLSSAIALAPSSNNSGLLTAEEIIDMKLQAELVVLSACNTGRGRITGDGVIGLSRSFVASGVKSVIVSLWSVPDDSTAELMKEFYDRLEKNPDKAQALRSAMLTTLEKNPHPKEWAAFTLIGESQ